MEAAHFLTKMLPRVSTEMSVHSFAYNLQHMTQIFGLWTPLRVIGA